MYLIAGFLGLNSKLISTLTPQQKNSMTNEKDTTEWWIDWMNQRGLSMRNVEGIAKHADMYELVAEAERRGEMKALEWLRDNASGGGDWRMKIEIKLVSLKKV